MRFRDAIFVKRPYCTLHSVYEFDAHGGAVTQLLFISPFSANIGDGDESKKAG